MELFRLTGADADALLPLHIAYKKSIGEDAPTQEDFASLKHAIEDERILFFSCRENGQLIGCCSVSITFSTFCYGPSGVFEDFFILPAYRHKSIAGALVAAVVGWFALKLLVASLKGRWFWLFGPYCIVAGLLTLIFF